MANAKKRTYKRNISTTAELEEFVRGKRKGRPALATITVKEHNRILLQSLEDAAIKFHTVVREQLKVVGDALQDNPGSVTVAKLAGEALKRWE